MVTHPHPIGRPSRIPGLSTCRNCGHDRKNHQDDDCCWQEIQNGSRTMLCACPGFQPLATATNDVEAATGQHWHQRFRQLLRERTHQNFVEKIAEVEQAIRQRMTEVRPSDGREWQELRNALQTLKFVKML